MKPIVFKDWEGKKRKYLQATMGQVLENIASVGEFVVAEAARRAPVDTGTLKGSITYRIETKGLKVTCWVGVPKKIFWGWMQEVGTVKMAAHPFLRPAVFRNGKKIIQLLKGGS